jgi:hypothetical protein
MERWFTGRGRLPAIAVLAALWSIPSLCAAQTPTDSNASPAAMDCQSYEQELARIEASSQNRDEIPQLRKSLPDSWTVKDGEQVYSVSTKEIADALRQVERDPTKAIQLKARLDAMRRQAEQLSGVSQATDVNSADQKLKKILQRGEFQDAGGPSEWDQLRARLARWIFEHVFSLLRFLHISQRTGNAIGWTFLFLAIVALFYAIYRWLTKNSKVVDFRAEVEPVASDAKHWVQEALAAADRGDFREAIHCAYWASVARLEDIRILPRDRARTPRESLRLLEHNPKEQSVLQSITRSFELIWYGYRPVSATEWAGAKKDLEKMGCLEASTPPTAPS